MKNLASLKDKVLVVGDVTVDCNIILTDGQRSGGKFGLENLEVQTTYGRAALLDTLFDVVLRRKQNGEHLRQKVGGEDRQNCDRETCPERIICQGRGLGRCIRRLPHTFSIWEKHVSIKGANRKDVWRVKDPLGVCYEQTDPESYYDLLDVSLKDTPPSLDLLVIDEAGFGYSGITNFEPPWKRLFDTTDLLSDQGLILLKLSRPVDKSGPLLSDSGSFQKKLGHYGDRLIVVISVNDLRRENINIRRELSWDHTVYDIYEALCQRNLKLLSNCLHVIVVLGADGVLLFSNENRECDFICDTSATEGVWKRERPGYLIGNTTCLIAAIGVKLLETQSRRPSRESLIEGARTGLRAMRTLHMAGYIFDGNYATDYRGFPQQKIGEVILDNIEEATKKPPSTPIDRTTFERFTISKDRTQKYYLQPTNWNIIQDAEGIARMGGKYDKLSHIPHATFGNLVVLDPDEVN